MPEPKPIHMVGLKPGAEPETVNMPNGDAMRAYIGGYFAAYAFRLPAGPARGTYTLWVDDDGLGKRLPFNFTSPLYGPIVGPVLISRTNADGDEVSLAPAEIAVIKAQLLLCRKGAPAC